MMGIHFGSFCYLRHTFFALIILCLNFDFVLFINYLIVIFKFLSV